MLFVCVCLSHFVVSVFVCLQWKFQANTQHCSTSTVQSSCLRFKRNLWLWLWKMSLHALFTFVKPSQSEFKKRADKKRISYLKQNPYAHMNFETEQVVWGQEKREACDTGQDVSDLNELSRLFQLDEASNSKACQPVSVCLHRVGIFKRCHLIGLIPWTLLSFCAGWNESDTKTPDLKRVLLVRLTLIADPSWLFHLNWN